MKKVFSIFMVQILSLVAAFGIFQFATGQTTSTSPLVVYEGFSTKVSSFNEAYAEASEMGETIQIAIEHKNAFEDDGIRPKLDSSEDEVDAALATRRNSLRNFYKTENAKFIEKHNIQNVIYVSKYSPFIYIDGSGSSNAIISRLFRSSDVKAVYITNSTDNKAITKKMSIDIDDTYDIVGFTDIKSSGYTGSGINVGILEAPDSGFVNILNQNLLGMMLRYMSDKVLQQ